MAEGAEMTSVMSSHFFGQLNAGGVRQSSFALMQTALGAGFLTLSFGIKSAGIGLGTILLVVDGVVVYLGMEIMLRGARDLQADNTAQLLSKCVGEWSRTALDLLLVFFGNGCIIAFLCLLGDFIPALIDDMVSLGWFGQPDFTHNELRTRCIIATIIFVIPLAIPQTLSALRYASTICVVAVFGTSCLILYQCRGHYTEHVDTPEYGSIVFFKWDSNFFKTYGIFLHAYNCHVNLVPVASELKRTATRSIRKICAAVVTLLAIFYIAIAWGGYLSFLEQTNANLLKNYGKLPAAIVCRVLLCVMLTCAIPNNLTPTIRSFRCFLEAVCCKKAAGNQEEALLAESGGGGHGHGGGPIATKASDKAQILFLKALCLCVQLSVALNVSSIADVMAFVGSSLGTILMAVIPLAVLLKARFEDFTGFKFYLSVFLLSGTIIISSLGFVVMVLQKLGLYPNSA